MASKRSRQAFEADLQKQESPYVFFGTPLPPLDERIRDDGSFVPVWKQEVTDDRGRKRLHGAFTGGFSAGYYNTVGSKEGWTPSAFVSSRQNRAKDSTKAKEQKPEDFMDEEDIRETEESRQLQTSDVFAGFGTEHDERRKGGLMDIFRPSEETMGVKLLKRMGWKEGQGIGPRLKRVADLDDGKVSSGEILAFAPRDVSTVSFRTKSGHKGLGYEDDLSAVLNTTKSPKVKSRHRYNDDEEADEKLAHGYENAKSAKNSKAAFGVGILNDTGSDDEDLYSMGPKISYNKVIGGDKKPKKKAASSLGSANPSLKTKPVFLSKKLSSLPRMLRKCHDGQLPPDGFVLADELDAFASMSLMSEKFKPPEIPAGWKSSLAGAHPIGQPSEFLSVAEAARASTQDSKSRASALGETQLPGKSVFDYLTPAARDRLALASGKGNLPPALSEKAPAGYEPSQQQARQFQQELVPKLDQDVALQALNRGVGGWMPYVEDEEKRARYRTFLEIRAGLRSTNEGDEMPTRVAGMSLDDWVVEMQEFARAAQVFKPVTGLMASRFTSSTTSLPQSATDETGNESLLTTPTTKPEDPSEVAARMGMFGPMTRSTSNFYPTRLVCKRFNVPMPDHASFDGGTEAPPFSSGSSSGLVPAESLKSTGTLNQQPPPTLALVESCVDPPAAGEGRLVDPEKNEAIEQEKPGQALFKAIFGSDDDDNDEE